MQVYFLAMISAKIGLYRCPLCAKGGVLRAACWVHMLHVHEPRNANPAAFVHFCSTLAPSISSLIVFMIRVGLPHHKWIKQVWAWPRVSSIFFLLYSNIYILNTIINTTIDSIKDRGNLGIWLTMFDWF